MASGLPGHVWLLGTKRNGESMGTILLALVLVYLYFLPLITANNRGARNKGSIAVINVFLGWTLIGWVVALAMAKADR